MSAPTNIPLTIKWGKETLELSSFVPAAGVKHLKNELEEKTGVPSDRMKLMAKSKGLWKGVLKDDADLLTIDWAAASAKPGGVTVLLMGSATKLTGPTQKTVFLEDLKPEEIAKVQEPSGLVNLGNTCYLNSVVQCLRAVPFFRSGLEQYRPGSSAAHALLMTGLRDTLSRLDRQATPVQPAALVQATQLVFPQFAQRGPQGQPMQQDAEEFFSGVLTAAAAELSSAAVLQAGLGVTEPSALQGADNLIDAVFGMKMKETLTCDELTTTTTSTTTTIPTTADGSNSSSTSEPMATEQPDAAAAAASLLTEAPVVSYDLHRKLVCNIQGGSETAAQTNVTYIAEGIQLALQGKIEKHSSVLGRDAMWTRTQRIARLPPILTVQFGRFYWKATPDSADHAGVKCKIMKPVAFNDILDVYEFCTPEIQTILKVSRDKALAAEEERINNKLKGAADAMEMDNETTKEEEGKDNAKAPAVDNKTDADEAMEDEEDDSDDDLKAALAMSMQETLPPVGPGLPENFQGLYELFAVVTHKGRDADGGHYMAWVKDDVSNSIDHAKNAVKKIADSDAENENWFVFDDDEVSPCKTEDVLKLKGGGDWHMSYLNFYRAKK